MVIVVLLILGFAGWLKSRNDGPDPVASVECEPFERPRTVEDINDFIDTQRPAPGWAGGDVGASTALADGRSFWVFGDTLRPSTDGGPTMVRNSILIMGDDCAGVYRPADGLAAIPDRDGEVGYWPTTVDSAPDGEGGTRVVVGLTRVKAVGDGAWDFQELGASAARFQVPAGGVPQLVEVFDIGPDEPDPSKPLWSAAAYLADDGTVHLYGTRRSEEDLVFGYSLHAARTTVPDLAHPERWEYWDGTTWVKEESEAVAVIEAEKGVSRALSVFERDGTWYAVSKQEEFLGSEMVIWTSPTPTGPFTATGPVASLPSDDEVVTYMALAHPELLPEKGSVVVSWSVNAVDPTTLQSDPKLYRPEFRRVPLP